MYCYVLTFKTAKKHSIPVDIWVGEIYHILFFPTWSEVYCMAVLRVLGTLLFILYWNYLSDEKSTWVPEKLNHKQTSKDTVRLCKVYLANQIRCCQILLTVKTTHKKEQKCHEWRTTIQSSMDLTANPCGRAKLKFHISTDICWKFLSQKRVTQSVPAGQLVLFCLRFNTVLFAF